MGKRTNPQFERQPSLYLWIVMFYKVEVKEFVVVLPTKQRVQTPSQWSQKAGLEIISCVCVLGGGATGSVII